MKWYLLKLYYFINKSRLVCDSTVILLLQMKIIFPLVHNSSDFKVAFFIWVSLPHL